MLRTLAFLCLFAPALATAAPLELNHQGRLLDANGDALTGSHDITVSLYANETDTDAAWTDTFTAELDGLMARARTTAGIDFLSLLQVLHKMSASLESPTEITPGHMAQNQDLVLGLLLRLVQTGPAPPVARMVAVIASQVLRVGAGGTSAAYGLFADVLDVLSGASGKQPVSPPCPAAVAH